MHRPGGIERVWRTSILPLLEEYHYGQNIDVTARYGHETIRNAALRNQPGAPETRRCTDY